MFDKNLLKIIFEELILLARQEKGCEYAYQCLADCYHVHPKWAELIVQQVVIHLITPDEISAYQPGIYDIKDGQYKLLDIEPGQRRLICYFRFRLDFTFSTAVSRPRISPSFSFDLKPKHAGAECPWCCLIYFDPSKKHHSKRCSKH